MSQPPYGPPAWPASPRPSRLPLVLSIVAIVLSLVVGALAIAALVKAAPKAEAPAAKVYSEQEVADAKKAVCDAYSRADRAVQAAGRRNGGDDQTAILGVAVNIRLALSESSSLLLRTLAEQPAAPNDLQEQIRLAANTYQDVAIDQIGDASQDELAPLFKQADSTDVAIKQACKG